MMKFERKEIGTIFSKLRAAVPEVRSSGNEGILLSGSNAIATNLELSVKALRAMKELLKKAEFLGLIDEIEKNI